MGDAYSMFCIGHTIMDNFTLDIDQDIKQKTVALHLRDTSIVALRDNLCGWNELISLFLSHNDYLNCSTLHRTVHFCLTIYGQCKFLNTPYYTATTVIPPKPFQYTYGVLTLCMFFIGILITSVVVASKQLYKTVRFHSYPITSL